MGQCKSKQAVSSKENSKECLSNGNVQAKVEGAPPHHDSAVIDELKTSLNQKGYVKTEIKTDVNANKVTKVREDGDVKTTTVIDSKGDGDVKTTTVRISVSSKKDADLETDTKAESAVHGEEIATDGDVKTTTVHISVSKKGADPDATTKAESLMQGEEDVFSASDDAKEIDSQPNETLQAAFSMFDTDAGGTITGDEIGKLMESLGRDATKGELDDVIGDADPDKSGAIDFNEFCDMMTRQVKDTDTEKEIREAFQCFDVDSNGFISASELKAGMLKVGEKLSDKEIAEMIGSDGEMNLEAFMKMMQGE